MARSVHWNTVWITGASTGIGKSLAIKLAQQGARVAVSARSADKLKELAADHQNIYPYALDVTDLAALRQTVGAIEDDLGPIDLAILNAGVGLPVNVFSTSHNSFHNTVAVNYIGAVDGVLAVLPAMRERGTGHIAIVASLAGYRGLPGSAAYSSAKAALINFAESIKPELRQSGIFTSVINPGFIKTPMTDQNDFPMPFLLSADEAADRTIKGLKSGKFEIAFPRRFVAILKILRVLPYALYFKIVEKWVLRK
jgi:short-subunit dehydrogenase